MPVSRDQSSANVGIPRAPPQNKKDSSLGDRQAHDCAGDAIHNGCEAQPYIRLRVILWCTNDSQGCSL